MRKGWTVKGILGVGLCIGLAFLSLGLASDSHEDNTANAAPVGLSLLFQNSAMAPITLVGNAPRYLQEIDLVATVPTAGDQGIQPLIDDSELSSLDWTGVEMVEEDWRPAGDGTFIRQRFYRKARWMERSSLFLVTPTDDDGRAVGAPLRAYSGMDGRLTNADDAFVRRFVARQSAFGCPAQGDCTGATFVAQGLVQLRAALQPGQKARTIPAGATRLSLQWTEQAGLRRTVQVAHAAPEDFPYGYGFQPALESIDPPGNGTYYVPGETVRFRVAFRDGSGRRLHAEGSLPTYGQFLRGEVPSGLRYYNGFALFPTLYYALKHREGLMAVALLGPLDRLKTPQTTVALEEFGGGQADFATPAVDGFTSLFANIPPNPIVFGGNPGDDDTPVSDVVPITIPEDALPGTAARATPAIRPWLSNRMRRSTSASTPCTTARSGSRRWAASTTVPCAT